MSPRFEHVEDDMRFAVTVVCDDIHSEKAIEHTFEDLFKGIDLIDAALSDDETYYYYSISVETPNAPDVPQEGTDALEEFDPWQSFGLQFWSAVAGDPKFHNATFTYADRLEATMRRAGEGLFEFETAALGEPAFSALAMANVKFVPCYTQLLRLWDMDHEVAQSEFIDGIIRRHGLCPETEDLLYARLIENPGQRALDQLGELLPFLDEQTGGFATSSFFRRIVNGAASDPWMLKFFDADLRAAANKILGQA